jgi:glyoxylase-like metal-dependent hydrolase (beta-lactamase superfamily II)
MNYRIIPLVLLKYEGEKGVMTFLTDYGKPIVRPFVLWYIRGAEKNIIVDTAIEMGDYKNYHPDFKNLHMDQIMSFEEALGSVGLAPEKVDVVIQTHLHFDHCYNTRKCVNAKVIVQEDELKFAHSTGPFQGLYRKELFEGLRFEVVKGDRELSEGIELIHVPGHSLGGQAVSIQTKNGKAIISGFCSIKENFYPKKTHPMAGHPVVLPGIMVDAVKAYESILKIKERADIILPLHDPELLEIKSIP